MNPPINNYQRRFAILLITGISLIYGGISSLGAAPIADLYRQPAVVPPPEENFSMGGQMEGDEIDREMDKYLKQLKDKAGLDVDQGSLDELIDSGSGSKTDHDRDSGFFHFSNAAPANDSDENNPLLSHQVAKGDTIWSISQQYGVKPETIVKHNPELGSRPLYIGEEILIYKTDAPDIRLVQKVSYYRVSRGDTLTGIASKYGVSLASLNAWNRLGSKSAIQVGQVIRIFHHQESLPAGYTISPLFIWPVKGVITSGFGRRRNPFMAYGRQYHKGLDIGAPIGTKFNAARDGVVVYAGRMGGYGNVIFVRHADGYMSVYGHCKLTLVKKGELVHQGEVIGEVGRTGAATGPHLHFEVRKWMRPINPATVFNLREVVPVAQKQITASRIP